MEVGNRLGMSDYLRVISGPITTLSEPIGRSKRFIVAEGKKARTTAYLSLTFSAVTYAYTLAISRNKYLVPDEKIVKNQYIFVFRHPSLDLTNPTAQQQPLEIFRMAGHPSRVGVTPP